MDDIKKGLGCFITFVVLVVAIKLMVDFPIIGHIISVVVLIIVGYLIYTLYNSTGDRYMKWKFGEDFQKAIDSGQLSLNEAYPCVPKINIRLKSALKMSAALNFLILPSRNVRRR